MVGPSIAFGSSSVHHSINLSGAVVGSVVSAASTFKSRDAAPSLTAGNSLDCLV